MQCLASQVGSLAFNKVTTSVFADLSSYYSGEALDRSIWVVLVFLASPCRAFWIFSDVPSSPLLRRARRGFVASSFGLPVTNELRFCSHAYAFLLLLRVFRAMERVRKRSSNRTLVRTLNMRLWSLSYLMGLFCKVLFSLPLGSCSIHCYIFQEGSFKFVWRCLIGQEPYDPSLPAVLHPSFFVSWFSCEMARMMLPLHRLVLCSVLGALVRGISCVLDMLLAVMRLRCVGRACW